MIYVYSVRHAQRHNFDHTLASDLDTGLSSHGHKFAQAEMGAALRKDIESIIKTHPGQAYSIEFVFGPSARTEETKDHLIYALKGLRHISEQEEPGIGHGNLGRFYGKTLEERRSMAPDHAHLLDNPYIKNNPLYDGYLKSITGGDSKEDVAIRVSAALQSHKLEVMNSDNVLPPLQFKIFVTHSLACQAIRRDLVGDTFSQMLQYEKHNPGSIRKFHGETMFAVKDDGFIFVGPPEKPVGEHTIRPSARSR